MTTNTLTLNAKEATCIYQAFWGDFDKTFLQAEFINNPEFVDEAKEALNAGKI